MDMGGNRHLDAPRAVVWAALNDPDVLRQCIPGCEMVEALSETEMTAKVTLKVGPVKASFNGAVTLSEIEATRGYLISGEGAAGAAGHARGSARVDLEDEGEGTLLTYTVKAEVGGKIAQVGGRLIDATAKKLADQFFTRLGTVLQAGYSPPLAQSA